MYHQRNVAFFAAFSARRYETEDLFEIAANLLALAPQLGTGFEGARPDGSLTRELIAPVCHLETVKNFEPFPDHWIDAGADINARPGLPLFRIRVGVLKDGPDPDGRQSFVLVQVSHALVEGADSALLSRSRTTARGAATLLPIARRPFGSETAPGPGDALARFGARLLGPLAAIGHLIAAGLYNFRPGPYAYRSASIERRRIQALALQLGVRQRALLFALGLIGLFGTAELGRRKKLTSTYSTIDAGGEAAEGGFMRMRMLFARFEAAAGLATLAQNIDSTLKRSEGNESGFNQTLNMSALGAHRWLHARAPFLYRRQVFNFMPYDAVLGLIPPHRLEGALTEGLMEPVHAGAALEGSNACVFVPGKTMISFNFYAQTKQLVHVPEMVALLESLSPPQSKPSLKAALAAEQQAI